MRLWVVVCEGCSGNSWIVGAFTSPELADIAIDNAGDNGFIEDNGFYFSVTEVSTDEAMCD